MSSNLEFGWTTCFFDLYDVQVHEQIELYEKDEGQEWKHRWVPYSSMTPIDQWEERQDLKYRGPRRQSVAKGLPRDPVFLKDETTLEKFEYVQIEICSISTTNENHRGLLAMNRYDYYSILEKEPCISKRANLRVVLPSDLFDTYINALSNGPYSVRLVMHLKCLHSELPSAIYLPKKWDREIKIELKDLLLRKELVTREPGSFDSF